MEQDLGMAYAWIGAAAKQGLPAAQSRLSFYQDDSDSDGIHTQDASSNPQQASATSTSSPTDVASNSDVGQPVQVQVNDQPVQIQVNGQPVQANGGASQVNGDPRDICVTFQRSCTCRCS